MRSENRRQSTYDSNIEGLFLFIKICSDCIPGTGYIWGGTRLSEKCSNWARLSTNVCSILQWSCETK